MDNEHSNKSVNIIVNGVQHTAPDKKITYEMVAALAFPELTQQAGVEFTVSYRRSADKDKPAGTLTPGKHTNAKDGTIFDVTSTTRS